MIKDKFWWIDIINKLITKTESADAEIKELQKTNPEVAEGLHQIRLLLQRYFTNKSFIEKIVNQINDQILQYALNNYFYKIELTNEDDLFDSLITSLNMLGEEINYSTVSRQYLNDVFNTIPEFIIVVDEKGIIQTVNQNILIELGEPKENILRANICSLFINEISFKELVNSADNKTILTLKNKKNNIPVTIKTSEFVESDHNETRIVFILSDLSEIIKYQQELENKNIEVNKINKNLKEALKKAEESDRLKSAFLANVSHEIRTPMSGIIGFTDLLKNPKLKEEEKLEYIDIIEKSGNRMMETINDIIDISKIESGQVNIEFSDININDLLVGLYEFFKIEADKKEIQFSYNFGLPNDDDAIISDSRMLEGILINLIKNALKFTKKGNIEFGYRINGDNIEFFVYDTGIGISKKNQTMIFKRFAQEEQGYTRQFEGSGLGLSITKAYVEMLKGSIRLESELNKGSKFVVSLPYTKSKKERILKETTNNHQNINLNRKINVLVAEDEDVNYNIISLALLNYYENIYRAVTGKEAIEILKEHPEIDLIMMDIKMPLMDGYEATRRIRESNKDIIIIAQTAYAFSEDRAKALEAGCDEYISKPINSEELLSKVLSLLSKKVSTS